MFHGCKNCHLLRHHGLVSGKAFLILEVLHPHARGDPHWAASCYVGRAEQILIAAGLYSIK